MRLRSQANNRATNHSNESPRAQYYQWLPNHRTPEKSAQPKLGTFDDRNEDSLRDSARDISPQRKFSNVSIRRNETLKYQSLKAQRREAGGTQPKLIEPEKSTFSSGMLNSRLSSLPSQYTSIGYQHDDTTQMKNIMIGSSAMNSQSKASPR